MGQSKAVAIGDVIGEATKATERARQLAASLQERRDTIDNERQTLLNRNEHIRALPLRREDAKEALFLSIDQQAQGFPIRTQWKKSFEAFAFPQRGYTPGNTSTDPTRHVRPVSLMDLEDAAAKGAEYVFTQSGFGVSLLTNELERGQVRTDAMCYFFGDVIKRKIEQQFDAFFPDYTARKPAGRGFAEDWEWQSASPDDLAMPIAQRRAEIAVNDTRINELDEQIAVLDEDLARLHAVTPPSSERS